MPPPLSQTQREQITAALFRQEPYPHICRTHKVSDRQVRRIAHCLRTWGTTVPPRKESTKPMGRPRMMTPEMQEELRQYVDKHPLAGLKELKAHIESKFDFECSRICISRRLKEMGYSLSIVSRGATSVEKGNLPELSHEDTQRLLRDPAAKAALAAGSGTVYAWLSNSKPVPRRIGVRPKRKQNAEADQTQPPEPAQEPSTSNSGDGDQAPVPSTAGTSPPAVSFIPPMENPPALPPTSAVYGMPAIPGQAA
ncbi:hypothetical protein VTN02DRAFT_2189 [Thermoascus thermophilus]